MTHPPRLVLPIVGVVFLFASAEAGPPQRDWQAGNVLPDFGVDSYSEDAYERSGVARTDLDILRVGLDGDYLYIEVDCKGDFLGSMDDYAVELDNDPISEPERGDWLIYVRGCDAIVGPYWVIGRDVRSLCGGKDKPKAFTDSNNDVGWMRPAVSEFPQSGDGYEEGRNRKADVSSYYRVVGGNLQIALDTEVFGVQIDTRIRAWLYEEGDAREEEFYLHDSRDESGLNGIDNLCGLGTSKWIAASVTFDSYLDSVVSTQAEYFPGTEGDFMYVWGRNYSADAPYAVAFYDASGSLVGVDYSHCDNNSVLLAEYQFGSSEVRSESLPWHACVYFAGRDIPRAYRESDMNRAVTDSFYVFARFEPFITLAERDTADDDICVEWESVNGLEYEILFSNALQDSYQVAEELDAADTLSRWVDDGSNTGGHPSTVVARFYKIHLKKGPVSPNTVGKFTRHLDSQMSLVSLPLVPYSSSIQDVLGRQLSGAPDEAYADRVWKWDPVSKIYDIAWLVDGVGERFDGKWWTGNPFGPSGMKLSCGDGFWIESRHGPQAVTFAGEVFDDSSMVLEMRYPMQLFGSCYPDTVKLVESHLKEDGATGRPSELNADRVWSWKENSSTFDHTWLVDSVGPSFDGKWWDSDPWGETNITLRPGVG
ncbi:MAG: hypothetical protein ACE5JA_01655, partial [bacterium]